MVHNVLEVKNAKINESYYILKHGQNLDKKLQELSVFFSSSGLNIAFFLALQASWQALPCLGKVH